MKILALEFSSPQRSVAVVDSGGAAGPLCLAETVETGARFTDALGLIEGALRQAGVDRGQIECLAVGLGPGSYNGIRLSIALAQGWQLARPVKLIGLSSAECIAAEVQAAGLLGQIEVIIDAQRGEIYRAGYELTQDSRREVEPLALGTVAEAETRLNEGATLAGPEVTNWFPGGRLVYPRAATVGRLAAGQKNYGCAAELEPIYLRETRFVKALPPRFTG